MCPISKINKARYPKNWKAIVARIKERAGNKCEFCGVPNYAIIWRYDNGTKWVLYPEGMEAEAWSIDGRKAVKIVLTTAHLDHTPENNSDENLRCLCQKCHLNYDAKFHAHNARQTREKKAGQVAIF